MTLSTPNTPQELLDMNQDTTLDQVEVLMRKVNYSDTLLVVKWLVTNLRDYHHETVINMMEKGEVGNIPSWVQDETKLNMVLSLLEEV